MLVLFFKSLNAARRHDGADKEPIDDKMRRILELHVEEAETAEDREWAERKLDRFRTVEG